MEQGSQGWPEPHDSAADSWVFSRKNDDGEEMQSHARIFDSTETETHPAYLLQDWDAGYIVSKVRMEPAHTGLERMDFQEITYAPHIIPSEIMDYFTMDISQKR